MLDFSFANFTQVGLGFINLIQQGNRTALIVYSYLVSKFARQGTHRRLMVDVLSYGMDVVEREHIH